MPHAVFIRTHILPPLFPCCFYSHERWNLDLRNNLSLSRHNGRFFHLKLNFHVCPPLDIMVVYAISDLFLYLTFFRLQFFCVQCLCCQVHRIDAWWWVVPWPSCLSCGSLCNGIPSFPGIDPRELKTASLPGLPEEFHGSAKHTSQPLTWALRTVRIEQGQSEENWVPDTMQRMPRRKCLMRDVWW